MLPPLERLETRRMLSAAVSGAVFGGVAHLGDRTHANLVTPRVQSMWQTASPKNETSRAILSAPVAPSAPAPLASTAIDSSLVQQAAVPAPPAVPQIASFRLLNGTTGVALTPAVSLTDGLTINLGTLSTRILSIQAVPGTAQGGSTQGEGGQSGKTKSIVFSLDGIARTDNLSPFTASPLKSEVGYTPWTPAVGSHTLTATPFAGLSGTGLAGSTQTITFNVIDAPVDPYPGRPVPSAGGTRYVVSPTGSIKTVAKAASLAKAGDVVLIAPGVYRESLRLINSGTADRPITFAPIKPGTVTLDGTGYGYILRGSVEYIHLQELTFDHAANTVQSAAVEVSGGWQLTDCIIQNTDGQGLVVYGDGATLTRVTAQYNGEEGISGSNCSNVVLTDCVTRYNNNGKTNPVWKNDPHALRVNRLYYVDTSWQAGAGKWVNTDHVTLNGVQSYGNRGTGIWFDYNNTNVVVSNCVVHDNTPVVASHFWEGVGISIEMCPGPVLLQNNTVSNQVGGDIVIASSRGVTAIGNTLTGGYIALNDWPRGDDYTLLNLDFHQNIFNDVFIWTGSDNWDESSGVSKDIAFDFDTWNYHATQLAIWNGVYYYTPADLQQRLGLEANGIFAQSA